jgi:phage-related protein
MATLDIRFIGSDDTKAALSSVAGGLKDVGHAADEAGKSGSGFFSGMLQTAGGFLAANVIGGITSQFTSFISGAVSDAREANQLMAQTEQVIKTTGNAAGVTATHITDVATALSAAAGKSLFGDDQVQQAENLFLTFTNIKGKVLDAATSISVDMAQALGGEPKSQAIQLGKALNDPIAGISALSRVGVTFDDQQKKLIKTYMEHGEVAKAQGVILTELNKEFGGSAEAAAKADGGMAQFKDRLGEAGETIGQALLPAIGKLTGIAADTLLPLLEQAAAWLGEHLPGAIDQASAAFDRVSGVVNTVVGVISAVVGSFSSAASSSDDLGSAVNDLSGIWTHIQEVINAIVPPIQAVIMAVFGQVATFLDAHGAEIQAFIKTTWDTIVQIIHLALDLIQATIVPVLTFVAGFISAHGAQIQAALTDAWNIIKAVIDAALTLIKGVITAALQVIHGDWSGAWNTIKEMSAQIVEDLLQVISSGLDLIKQSFDTTIDLIKGVWDGLVGDAAGIGNDIVNGILNGVKGAADQLIGYMKSLANDALKAAKDALGISSPSQVFADELGQPLVMGILEGMQGALPQLYGLVDDMGKSLEDQVTSIADKVSGAIADGFDATASIDRLMAKNLDAVAKLDTQFQAETQAKLDAAAAQAAKIADPQEAARYYKQQSSQILELAKLGDDREQARKAGDMAAVARYDQQIQLIQQAQAAEQKAAAERQAHQQSPQQAIVDQIAKLLNTPGVMESGGPAIAQLIALMNQLTGGKGPQYLPPPPGIDEGPNKQGYRLAGDNRTPQAQLKISVDDRGMAWLQNLIKVEVDGVLAGRGGRADLNIRTGR